MKTLILLIVFLSSFLVGLATSPSEYSTCIEYAYTNYNARAGTDFRLGYDVGGGLIIEKWTLPVARPSFAFLESVKTNALAWKADRESDFTLVFDKITKAYGLVVKDEINLLRANLTSTTNLPIRTTGWWKTNVQEKYNGLP